MPDYRSQLIRRISTFILNRTDAVTSIPRLRRLIRKGSALMGAPRGVRIQSENAAGVPAEWITPSSPLAESAICYFHGGGWILGWSNSHRHLVAHICRASACPALAVDYRLAPEDPFPAALDDCLAAYRWLLEEGYPPQKIILAGDSAGGNLVLSVLISLRNSGGPLPAAGVCISPMTDLACTGASFTSDRDILLSPVFASRCARLYAGTLDPRLPLLSPLYDSLESLPPLLIHAGEDEILLDDSTRIAEKAHETGVDVTLKTWPGMSHVFHVFSPYLPEAKEAVNRIGVFVHDKFNQSA